MNGATVVSKANVLLLEQPLNGKVIADELIRVITNIAKSLAYKDKIIGHIKAIVIWEDEHLHVSTTSIDQLAVKMSKHWYENDFSKVKITINIIVFNYDRQFIENVLSQSIRNSIFATM